MTNKQAATSLQAWIDGDKMDISVDAVEAAIAALRRPCPEAVRAFVEAYNRHMKQVGWLPSPLEAGLYQWATAEWPEEG